MAAVVSRTCMAPLERVKMEMVVSALIPGCSSQQKLHQGLECKPCLALDVVFSQSSAVLQLCC